MNITTQRRYYIQACSIDAGHFLYLMVPVLSHSGIWRLKIETPLPSCEVRFSINNFRLTEWLNPSEELLLEPAGWTIQRGEQLTLELRNNGSIMAALTEIVINAWGWSEK